MVKRVWMAAVLGLMSAGGAAAGAQKVLKADQLVVQAPAAPVSAENLGATQEKLMDLLHVTPTLANVVANDPSLLADQQYVARTNPELAAFLAQHPEITRNPAFYLFSNLRGPNQRRYPVLEQRQGFERVREPGPHNTEVVMHEVGPLVVLILVGGAVLWLVRVGLENRRWGKVFRMQSEAHARLIEKFGSNEELLRYMETDAGKRFLEAAPIAMESTGRGLPNVVSRVLTSLQGGLVLALLGAGFLGVRKSVGEAEVAMLVLGMLTLMPGIALILSAGVTWYLGRRMELIAPARMEAAERL